MGTLRLLLGQAGSGKTTELFTRALDGAERNPDRNYLFIVPEHSCRYAVSPGYLRNRQHFFHGIHSFHLTARA